MNSLGGNSQFQSSGGRVIAPKQELILPSRRGLLKGLAGILACAVAPPIVRAASIMPVRSLVPTECWHWDGGNLGCLLSRVTDAKRLIISLADEAGIWVTVDAGQQVRLAGTSEYLPRGESHIYRVGDQVWHHPWR